MAISGTTRLFPIVGRPVNGVFSPPAYNAWFKANGLDFRMFALDIASDSIETFWTLLRTSPSFLGCSVTCPHKRAAFETADRMSDRAARLAALNTLRRDPDGCLTGDATDGLAMVEAARACGERVTGRSAYVLGAGGGAGQAVADALCEAGVDRIILKDIDIARETAIAAKIGENWPDTEIETNDGPADILVNATALGKGGTHPLPFLRERVASADTVCDVVTGSTPTALVSLASALKKRTVTGNDMGQSQVAPQMRFIGLCRPRSRKDMSNFRPSRRG